MLAFALVDTAVEGLKAMRVEAMLLVPSFLYRKGLITIKLFVMRQAMLSVLSLETGGGEHILYNCQYGSGRSGEFKCLEYPLEGIIANGWIHGRGASDTKRPRLRTRYVSQLSKN